MKTLVNKDVFQPYTSIGGNSVFHGTITSFYPILYIYIYIYIYVNRGRWMGTSVVQVL